MRAWIRSLHVLSTAIVGAQLLVWTGTGLAFTLFDFAAVRGTNDRAPPRPVELSAVRVAPDAAVRAAARGARAAESVTLTSLGDRATYRVSFVGGTDPVLVDAAAGTVVAIDEAAAARLATSAHRGTTRLRGVERRREDDHDVFVVRLDDPADTEVTIDAHSGEVTAWKNRQYRRFDALWSAHVLGYIDRKSPANWPLRVVAFLAVLVSMSGAALLVTRARAFFTSNPNGNIRWPVTKSPPFASGS